MALYKILRYPQGVLLQKTQKVSEIGPREKLLVRDMIETMHAEKGVGLAANQIGVPLRVFVASPDGQKGKELAFFNPRIIKRSGCCTDREGCLSIPGHYESVARSGRVTLEGTTPEGEVVKIEAEGFLARIFQHETDHLEGRLYVHRLGFFKKRRLLKELAGAKTGNAR